MFKFKSDAPARTAELARRLAGVLRPGTVICLDGDLGAGKTLFVQNLAASLGVQGEVTSPTFNLMNLYEDGRLPLVHFDLYRLEQEYELDEIGFYDYVENPDGLVLIEWAEKFPECLPEDHIALQIQRTDVENERVLVFSLAGSALQDVYKEMEKLCQF
ncbi:MAG: tRNA (adenosine(37)-N6)-threonylcarbamoyltransferase complex ATPase subunit type 1 TsaE [Selenomonadaceae bacterium]|uniref:tRNA (adenosine(37)-N6)-threonylcarbamoyltransferase complex ATPase subunit type 1 TsaE n=1 Tax=Anaerovibrio TaxID=82373 RepID=UPI0023F39D6D|nr:MULTISPECIES: tRNA (adenosine(37)-N6)-threonylcarbamoyltransferase complex ATPase subunit type 1 TsaE [Anaerovibrio]MCI6097620.1 tRNA (adenosine(37)-N6)-threonylcarbamoyltransferase complex ATPase subunit type 1 TsaE [Selenomonadaceae bacterium]MCI6483855.1 tRNA (adenosine(37)-N6)-threonylcarbamoyltransferase complex ATPase subunit type 1 TsaE [Selenomonadaceae bacterium]MDD6163207.1 tRNA (adenosine(37)-N6)-threonylcarbamoyltransferase complex ATPase subunit type 1 TsaE [Anaerovibrio slackiae